MDERRSCRLQGFIKQSAEIEKAVVPIINTCIGGITQAASSINPSEVSAMNLMHKLLSNTLVFRMYRMVRLSMQSAALMDNYVLSIRVLGLKIGNR